MANRIPAETTRWVIEGGIWLQADKPVEVVHYTNATLFVNNGRVIDGRATGLSDEDFKALKAKYPDDVVKLSNEEFSLPLVPVGTVIDITPAGGAPAASRAAPAPKTPASKRGRSGPKRSKARTPRGR